METVGLQQLTCYKSISSQTEHKYYNPDGLEESQTFQITWLHTFLKNCTMSLSLTFTILCILKVKPNTNRIVQLLTIVLYHLVPFFFLWSFIVTRVNTAGSCEFPRGMDEWMNEWLRVCLSVRFHLFIEDHHLYFSTEPSDGCYLQCSSAWWLHLPRYVAADWTPPHNEITTKWWYSDAGVLKIFENRQRTNETWRRTFPDGHRHTIKISLV